jgi:hypothetical protein
MSGVLVPSVVDARIRYRLGSLVPLPAGPWSAQVPRIADPERRAYITEIAALMDARKDRIGEHAAEHGLPWAVAALGPVPAHPPARLDWQNKAASIGAFRELSGYDHPADPIGPEPAAAAPDVRAAWYEALAALGPADGPDVRGMPDGRLLHLRDTYPIETAWAPWYVGDELRQVRTAAWNAHLAALRARAEAKAASSRSQHDTAARQQELAGSYHALHETYWQRETVFAAVMADRADWDAATRVQRHRTSHSCLNHPLRAVDPMGRGTLQGQGLPTRCRPGSTLNLHIETSCIDCQPRGHAALSRGGRRQMRRAQVPAWRSGCHGQRLSVALVQVARRLRQNAE